MTAPLRLLRQAEVNASAADGWTLVHIASGAALGMMGVSLPWTVGLGLAYEVAEYAHESPRGSALFGSKRPESLVNVAVDMVALVAGWWAFR